MQLGLRVVRGAGWKWGEQDGGEGCVGTVVKPAQHSCDVVLNDSVFVCWDSGQLANYRVGCDGAHDLCQFDNAAGGLSTLCHLSVVAGNHAHQFKNISTRHICMLCYFLNLSLQIKAVILH